MKHAGLLVVAAVILAGCSQEQSAPPPQVSDTVTTQAPTPAGSPQPASQPPATSRTSPSATVPTTAKPGVSAFCKYLKKTAGAQQQVEDPAQFVALVNGALAVAPGAIREDLVLYAQSVQKLADTVTAGPKKAAAADKWLSDNADAVAQAEANLNGYSESVCGVPFITGEGG